MLGSGLSSRLLCDKLSAAHVPGVYGGGDVCEAAVRVEAVVVVPGIGYGDDFVGAGGGERSSRGQL